MFTGIIEEVGQIQSVKKGQDWCQFTIRAEKVLRGVKLGDSIAVNGTCLTVTSFTDKEFTVDLMPETLKSTNLGQLRDGSSVNLERAMAAGDRFGGHFVSGHIDGVGKIVGKTPYGNAVVFRIATDSDLLRYIVPKGSVAIDGISLTVVSVDEGSFTVSIIPHTMGETVLKFRTVNDQVNLECDMIGKYIEQFISHRLGTKGNSRGNRLDAEFLREHGFMS